MRTKVLVQDAYRIVGIMDGDECPAEDFLLNGESSTAAARVGLLTMLEHIASCGLQHAPPSWFHEANKEDAIYEFIKGPLRLFFFKGLNGDIAVCTSGIRKQGKKADKASVSRAASLRAAYLTAIRTNDYEVIEDED